MDLIQVYVKYDLYEELELTNLATKDDIKKKYKKLAIRFHPDKYLQSDQITEEEKKLLQSKFNLVNIAYDILLADDVRIAYDKARKDYLEGGQFMDLKSQFTDTLSTMEFDYGDKDKAKSTFDGENEKLNSTNEKLAEEIREKTKQNLTKTFEVEKNEELFLHSEKPTNKGEYLQKFNNLFDTFRTKPVNTHTEIIAYNNDDNIPTLDTAFDLLPVSERDYVDNKQTLEERMKLYEAEFAQTKLEQFNTKNNNNTS
jgi:curved DNA-binding protein CbpA